MSSTFNKDRLYLALYARGNSQKPNTYHWSLIIGPKTENDKSRGLQLHAKQTIISNDTTSWFFEEREIPTTAANMLLIRIMIAKIRNIERTLQLIHAVPVRQGVDGWTCVSWVQEAIKTLDADGDALGTRVMDWDRVSQKAVSYCDEKKVAGRFRGEQDLDSTFPPTFDFTVGQDGKEAIP